MTPPQVAAEVAIGWEQSPGELECPYVRESVVTSRYRTRPPRIGANDGERVAYAILASDADPPNEDGICPEYIRRVWWLSPEDPYGPPGPAEAVDPSSVTAGEESKAWGGGL